MEKCSDPFGKISIHALGRPFMLGRFYDICQDRIIQEQIRPPVAFDYEDPIKSLQRQCLPQEILEEIDIDPKTKLGVAINVEEYPGCFSAFMNDFNSNNVKSGKCYLQQCRFRSTQIEDSYLRSRLGQYSKQSTITATHIVQKITFGCNSIIWMDDETPEGEKKYLRTFLFENIPNITESQEENNKSISFKKEELSSFRCKMYSDVDPISPCNNLYQALEHFEFVQKFLSENSVPVEVTLYPLPIQREANLSWELGNTLANKALCFWGNLNDVEDRCMKLLDDPDMDDLIREDITAFQNLIGENKRRILMKLKRLTQKNYLGLEDLIGAVEKSPFNSKTSIQWLEDKERDWKRIKETKTRFPDLTLSKALHKPSAKLVFELVLQLPNEDALQQAMTKYLHAKHGLVNVPQYTGQPENTNAFDTSCESFQKILQMLKGSKENASLVLVKSDVPFFSGSVRYYMNSKLVDRDFKLPMQPKHLEMDISATSFKLAWMTSDPKPENENYEIMIRDEKGNERHFASNYCCFETEALDSYTQFRITIVALNGPIRSEPSQEIRIITLPKMVSVPTGRSISQLQQHKTEVSAPGKPNCLEIATRKLRLQWTPPEDKTLNVSKYLIFEAGKTSIAEQRGDKTEADVDILPNVVYSFTIQADFVNGVRSDHSEKSDIFEKRMSKDELRVECIKEQSTCITKPGKRPQVYLLNLKRVGQNSGIQKFEFGTEKWNVPEKVVMLLGATGSGKTTLINGMANVILGIKWDDDFRIKLVPEEEEVDQTKSQTTAITSYTIHAERESSFPFSLTLVDTPGFGDTSGFERDKEIMSQIKDFFSASSRHRLDHIDGIGLVVPSSLARLTPIQLYIFDSILSIFGKDIAENIFPLLTFSDGRQPQVLSTLSDEIPHSLHYKFNNSALYADGSENTKFNKMFWDMGDKNYREFLNSLLTVNQKSLSLTKEVLEERNKLEAQVEGIRQDIEVGLHKMEELEYEWTAIQQHQEELAQNKEFMYTVTEETVYRDKLGPNQLAMNCSRCLWSCHYPCFISQRLFRCMAFDRENSLCKHCPQSCHSDCHESLPYKYRREWKVVEKTSRDLLKKYCDALDKKGKHEKILESIASDINKTHVKLTEKLLKVKGCLERLREIALKPSLSSTAKYVEQMIDAEKLEQDAGWEKRVNQLEEVKETAEYLDQLTNKGFNPFKSFSETLEKVKNHFQKDGRNLLRNLPKTV